MLPALALAGLLLVSIWVALAATTKPSSAAPFIFTHVINEASKLTASDAQADDRFGNSVSISGDTIVVGAVGEDGGPGDPHIFAGAAYVFSRDQGGADNWGQVARLTASDAGAHDLFGGSVSINGDTIVVGAKLTDGAPGNPLANNAGAAYVFGKDEGGVNNWGEVIKLTPADLQANDEFGNSVSINGDTIVVAAWHEEGGPGDPLADAGAVYVFERDQGGADNWGEVAKLVASDAQAEDGFGFSVSIAGDTIVVGALHEDGGPGDPLVKAGAAYVFGRDQGGANNWGEVAKLTASDAQGDDWFGWAVSISGETIVVGAQVEDGGPGDPLGASGAAYVFGRDEGGVNNWGEVTKLTASDAQSVDRFGFSVSISGDSIVVGAIFEDGGPGDPLTFAGSAYLFARNRGGTNNWGEVAKLTPSDARAQDRFGRSVSISADMIVAGAHDEDTDPGDPLAEAGAAYVFLVLDQSVYLPLAIRD
jgi:hypothetical protein